MPSHAVHQTVIKNNEAMIERLVSQRNVDDNPWLLVITYFTIRHYIERAADGVNDIAPKPYEDLVEFLSAKDSLATQYFTRMHVFSMFIQYGVSVDSRVCKLATNIIMGSGFREELKVYVKIIKDALE